jgi:hypothetical protein
MAAVVSFHLAYMSRGLLFARGCQWLVVPFSLLPVSSGRTWHPQAGLFLAWSSVWRCIRLTWRSSGPSSAPAAIALWCILSFWLGLFLWWEERVWPVRPRCLGLAAPFLWTGLEYFRSELYYLRFSWLNAGYAFSNSASAAFPGGIRHVRNRLSAHGVGGLCFAWRAVDQSSSASRLEWRWRPFRPFRFGCPLPESVRQTYECDGHCNWNSRRGQVKSALDAALKKYPQTDLFVLSEYAFQGPFRRKSWTGARSTANGWPPAAKIQFRPPVLQYGVCRGAGRRHRLSTGQMRAGAVYEGWIARAQQQRVEFAVGQTGLRNLLRRQLYARDGRIDSARRASLDLSHDGQRRMGRRRSMNCTDGLRRCARRSTPCRFSGCAVPAFRNLSGAGWAGVASAPFPGQGAMLSAPNWNCRRGPDAAGPPAGGAFGGRTARSSCF